ncbi:MAG: DedA family protein, partial [Cyanobacteria bacterium J06641_2]
KMPFIPFLLYTFAGSLIWTAILTYAGLLLGNNFQQVEKYIKPISGIVFASLAIYLIIIIIRRKNRG